MNPVKLLTGLVLVWLLAGGLVAQPTHEAALKNLKFREIGPAIMGGRVDDFAFAGAWGSGADRGACRDSARFSERGCALP